MPARRPRRRLARWGGAFLTLLLLLIYAANVPFYSGSTIGRGFAWRMEHGRLALHRGSVGHESFYIAANAEWLRFAPEWRVHAWRDWHINIPLWMPVLALLAWTTHAWVRWARTPRQEPGVCPKCRYDTRSLAGGAVCPECGTPLPAPHA